MIREVNHSNAQKQNPFRLARSNGYWVLPPALAGIFYAPRKLENSNRRKTTMDRSSQESKTIQMKHSYVAAFNPPRKGIA